MASFFLGAPGPEFHAPLNPMHPEALYLWDRERDRDGGREEGNQGERERGNERERERQREKEKARARAKVRKYRGRGGGGRGESTAQRTIYCESYEGQQTEQMEQVP